MTISRWDPFRDLMAIQERMNSLFQDTLSRQRGQETLDTGTWVPAVDICETGDRIVIRADLPGIEQSDIEIRVEEMNLTIRGDRKAPAETGSEDFHRAERPHGPFMRSFNLPRNIDQNGIKALQKNGVLEISLPKRKEDQAKAIRIDVK